MRHKTLRLVLPALAVGVACAAGIPGAQETPTETPLIAELVATPEAFSGKTVTVYGLVVGASEGGAVFMLQDVSQNPLRVVSGKGIRVTVGDQVLVRGVFRTEGGRPFISADFIEPVKVTGGG